MEFRPMYVVLLSAALMSVAGCGQQSPSTPAPDVAAKARIEAEAQAKAEADAKAKAESDAKDKAALADAVDAYVYGYPLVTMEYTRRISTNVEAPEGTRAPMGQFARLRQYPDASFRTVTAPNADTLYTVAWLDVGDEPWIVSLPDMKGRYALFPMLDGFTNVFEVPGKRTTGTGAQKFAITGPGWTGALPPGVKEYKSPTAMVWLLGRIYCTGTPEDYKAVHALQDQVSAVPLSAYGTPYTPAPGKVDPAIDEKTAAREQVNALDGVAYFRLLAKLLKTNPLVASDAPMAATLARVGIVPGQEFDASKLDLAAAKGIASAPRAGQEKIQGWFKGSIAAGDATFHNGWLFTTRTGEYGTNYLQRAMIAWFGLGANRPQDAIYPTSETDADGKPYDGANQYVIRFEKGQMPPADAFWSLTMYNADYFFVENPLDRYAVSSRTRFKPNRDGSVDIYIQNESPGKDKESNWLPAPKDKFVLMLRMYWPREKPPSLLDGTWNVPAVARAS